MNNKDGEQLTISDQYNKLNRALRIVLNTNITPDDYTAIIQLMTTANADTCLILDNSYENI